ncbi:tRNA uridine-5-carboxymethylaminomethyl(34) synthesis GTPase MnmE [Tenacibaculum finnmarkense genomovar finnmarkense]|uniref:tRNA modification GTPase MnmE n=1 Tax=Tenacibaculum finnmarkense genomovar finnmarkense TaxID=1458503 RepID=A0AAP1REE8_9FLAO|nr:tRNA uridine-5-carboxymethylaminomethyl(34) synthesis GTPase MnmE [Tenacibaculum finnmarkense]MBE7652465.1 tRNA uridine-5-carboxymethylaminomethyl(34) synthesis GTPase MnmE [Tenacibaculum finnmarkense genomovar finnmarkense]MBE7660505.1 tRNA uridine-5-carboxymethylaminomethyl(34) synthesis GTPase MnmE [Tenacibaculum finnmarkense genomovar finnmarkense]MBE7694725.1 tRNA uridine-5-carboxymethylaminomethyl(34) synthesis GTPase MnmE [Tenacibaculum finnmarkense genomovar finnmarkense]MCD8402770.1
MIQNDTIIAMATPSGVGAIAVIRLSGEKAIDIVNTFFKSIKSNKSLLTQKTHTLHLGHIFDKNTNTILDEVLVSIFKNPTSYTGENIVEISCHGSVFIQQEIIQLFLKNGCRMADNGEFTMRAFLNGKMDLSQAEAVADVIASNSAASHQMAIQQMRGGITNELKDLRIQLLDFAALIELELDFSGEDVEFADRTKFKQLVAKITFVLKRLIDSFAFGNAMKNGIPVAIIGEPNVGKSTLLNTLLNEEKAIVSDIAGTTRDAIEDDLIIDGVAFRFIDTAGIRETKDIIENIGIKKAYEKAENAQLIIFLIDANKFAVSSDEFLQEIETIKERFPTKRLLVIANKIDRLSCHDTAILKSEIDPLILVSAKQKTGIIELKAELTSLVNTGALSNNETIVTNSRHFEALNNALTAITSVQQGIDLEISTDLFSIDIRECLRHLGNITGEYDVDKDILGHIFGNFCIGK